MQTKTLCKHFYVREADEQISRWIAGRFTSAGRPAIPGRAKARPIRQFI